MSCAKLLSNMALNSLQIDEGSITNPTDSEEEVDDDQDDYPDLVLLSDSEGGEVDDQDDFFENHQTNLSLMRNQV